MKKNMLKAGMSGLIAGLVLNYMFKFVELVTEVKIYTLLLNVDYIPIVNRYTFPEVIEIAFHLIVSIVLSLCFYLLISYMKITAERKVIELCIVVCVVIGIVLFPTTALSDRTPSVTSLSAFSIWVMGHALYGFLLGVLQARWIIRNPDRYNLHEVKK